MNSNGFIGGLSTIFTWYEFISLTWVLLRQYNQNNNTGVCGYLLSKVKKGIFCQDIE